MNTYMAKAADVQRKWYVVDAEGVVLGRLASQVASDPARKEQAYLYPSC